MNVKLFCHSLTSDWNHGNAHFLRGVVRELSRRGHSVVALEPCDSWSRENLVAEAGEAAVAEFQRAFPDLHVRCYHPGQLDLDSELADADLVVVHDWNDPSLVAAIGEHRRQHRGYVLLFYDAHHRAATAPEQIAAFELSAYDAVLAFGAVIRDLYIEHRWARRAYVWHEAADTSLFSPRPAEEKAGDLVWIGNWGDGERTSELHEFLLEPATTVGLSGHIHGVRYPEPAREAVRAAGLIYEGWLPNFLAPEAFGRHRVTVHIPRRAYVRRVPGVPTIRVFEALACGIPLVCAPWDDRERLFTPGQDYLVARNGQEMAVHLRMIVEDPAAGAVLARRGRQTVLARHTCRHRVDELLAIVEDVG